LNIRIAYTEKSGAYSKAVATAYRYYCTCRNM